MRTFAATCLAFFLLALSGARAADPGTKSFNIPSGDAATTLRLFVEQSGEQIVFLVDHVRGVTTNAVSGEYTPRGALEQIALMAMQTGIGLSRAETLEYAASVIDVVVQLDRIEGKRGIAAIAESRSLVSCRTAGQSGALQI